MHINIICIYTWMYNIFSFIDNIHKQLYLLKMSFCNVCVKVCTILYYYYWVIKQHYQLQCINILYSRYLIVVIISRYLLILLKPTYFTGHGFVDHSLIFFPMLYYQYSVSCYGQALRIKVVVFITMNIMGWFFCIMLMKS